MWTWGYLLSKCSYMYLNNHKSVHLWIKKKQYRLKLYVLKNQDKKFVCFLHFLHLWDIVIFYVLLQKVDENKLPVANSLLKIILLTSPVCHVMQLIAAKENFPPFSPFIYFISSRVVFKKYQMHGQSKLAAIPLSHLAVFY